MGETRSLLSNKTIKNVIKQLRKLFDNKEVNVEVINKIHRSIRCNKGLRLDNILYSKTDGKLVINAQSKTVLAIPVFNFKRPYDSEELHAYFQFMKDSMEINYVDPEGNVVETIKLII